MGNSIPLLNFTVGAFISLDAMITLANSRNLNNTSQPLIPFLATGTFISIFVIFMAEPVK